MLYLLTLGLAYGQDCAAPVTSATLDTQLDSVAMGFLEMDGEKVQSGLQNIQSSIPCLNETLDPIVAHEYHMLNGLSLVLARDTEAAHAALRLAKRLAPEKTIPTHLFPNGHNIHDVYAGLEYIELDSAIPSTNRGVYIFNGQTVNRALGTNNIVQIKEGSTILLSAIIKDGEPLPQAPETSATNTVSTTATNTAPTETATAVTEPIVTPTQKKGLSSGAKVWGGTLAIAGVGMVATSTMFCNGFSLTGSNCNPDTANNSVDDLTGLYMGYYLSAATALVSGGGLTYSLMKQSDDE
jgi:hypothetical protein